MFIQIVTLKLWGKDEAQFEDYIILQYMFQVGGFNHQLDQEVFGFLMFWHWLKKNCWKISTINSIDVFPTTSFKVGPKTWYRWGDINTISQVK